MIPDLRAEDVHSVMEPLELYRVLEKFDLIVEFKPVEFIDLPACECGGGDCADLASEAVISYRHRLPHGRRSHTYRHAVNGGCLGWQLTLLTRDDAPYFAEKLTVEVLMINKER